jgi:hypothetical protein
LADDAESPRTTLPAKNARASRRIVVSVELGESERKEAFLMLVGLQDGGHSVEDSRDEVATHYGISASEVLSIEREGIDKSWPPL